MSLKANSAIMGIVSRLGASSRTGQALQTQSSIPQTCRNTSLELQLPESVLASYNRSASSNYTSHKLGGNTIRSYMRNAHKNVNLMAQMISPTGKILPRSITGVSAKQQRILSATIKRARIMGTLPYPTNRAGIIPFVSAPQ